MKTAIKETTHHSPLTTREARQQLKTVIVGHVDHGKSTLVGRLLYDTNSLPDGKFEAIQASSKKRGMPFEWSFLMDALQTERDQGITIDTTQIWLRTESRDVVIIDAPGHKEFLKNMITGAAQADAALVLIDAHEGIREQSKRHGYLLHLLGVRQIAVLVNKMDMVGYDEKKFRAIEAEYRDYLRSVGVEPTCFIPISAREGDGITGISKNMPWYKGDGVTQALEHFEVAKADDKQPLRFPIQDVYKFDERRILAGRIESGTLRVGDELLLSPSNTKVKVASIEAWGASSAPSEVSAGQSVGITLTDQVFVERGHIASHIEHAPVLTNQFRARIFWLGHKPLEIGKRYKIKLGTTETFAEIKTIEHVIDSDTLAQTAANRIERGNVAEVVFRTRSLIAVDDFNQNAQLGRFVILQDYDVAGGGIISMDGFYDQRTVKRTDVKSTNLFDVDFGITPEQRALANGHMGGVLWFTGLSGSGKSTIAKQVQKRLFDKGYHVFVLDGDNVRKGLNRDLDFSPEGRSENIRRVAEMAALFAKSGTIVISSFISPYREDRKSARAIASNYFHNIYIKASVEACEKRDTKGLYAKARAGEIKDFTGVNAPYEEPENPDLVLDTESTSIAGCVDALVKYIEHQLVEPVRNLELQDMEGYTRDYTGTGI
ncbi:MAG: adenylyl-sulfate kinase [Rickettsiales bacterium]|nr:adenylyl-sulfate kinase [Rickettsiales bacterium]